MSFLDKLSALTPFGKKVEVLEYFFALNITSEKLTAALWTLDGKQLKILDEASEDYSSLDDLTPTTDKLLDAVVGAREVDVAKILFGVPPSWLLEENLKEEYLKVLRSLVKELELTPMAYVESSRALGHFLEKKEGVPTTAILVGFETHHLSVTVLRAGKIDGTKVVSRAENTGGAIEKALLNFTNVETLPSKILIYGSKLSGLKDDLLSYPWMSKLSFLHYPKIETLPEDTDIKSICLAGASEINEDAHIVEHQKNAENEKIGVITSDKHQLQNDEKEENIKPVKEDVKEGEGDEGSGFIVGDVSVSEKEEIEDDQEVEKGEIEADEDNLSEDVPFEEEGLVVPEEASLAEIDDFEKDLTVSSPALDEKPDKPKMKFSLKKYLPRKLKHVSILAVVIGIVVVLLAAYLFLPKADIKIFVEPKVVEKDTQVTADPNQKTVNEDDKIIPGKLVETEASGSKKDTASGKKQIGDPAKGTVLIYNKTFESKTISKGTILTSGNGFKFSLDVSVNIASASSTDSGITYGKENRTVTAAVVGADSNLPSGSELTVGNFSSSQVSAKAEGNFSGGTSKEVTVVSEADQKRLLASLSSDLRKEAQQKLQEKLQSMKILEESLAEEVTKKSFNKNINDQATEFSLNLTNKYKGTAFEEKDLKLIVSKLVNTQVPEGFQLNLEDTETQADVSKLEKDGKLIFLARFKAKLLPKIDTDKVMKQIKGKSVLEAIDIIKKMENVLGAEINTSPKLPPILQRVPYFSKNIKIEVGLK